VLVLPINAASDRTSGVDINLHYALDAGRWGNFGFNVGYTYVINHEIQFFAGDPTVDELADLYNYVIPRNKANFSVNWTRDAFTATLYGARTGGLPNYDGTKRLAPTFMYNASLGYQINERTNLSFVVDNLLDTKTARDSTWTAYPYYSRNWFNAVGRAYFAEINYRFGGER
jgi:outer membrane receptor protein involved in Fe transport